MADADGVIGTGPLERPLRRPRRWWCRPSRRPTVQLTGNLDSDQRRQGHRLESRTFLVAAAGADLLMRPERARTAPASAWRRRHGADQRPRRRHRHHRRAGHDHRGHRPTRTWSTGSTLAAANGQQLDVRRSAPTARSTATNTGARRRRPLALRRPTAVSATSPSPATIAAGAAPAPSNGGAWRYADATDLLANLRNCQRRPAGHRPVAAGAVDLVDRRLASAATPVDRHGHCRSTARPPWAS